MKQYQYSENGAKAVCQKSGFVVDRNDTVLQWDGKRVCKDYADPKPDYLRPKKKFHDPKPIKGAIFPDDYVEGIAVEGNFQDRKNKLLGIT